MSALAREGEVRREELSAFLRARRAQIKPEEVGLPRGVRRRTAGLRREEVAQLAGIGVTWYTWLEQGRNISVSSHFLERLARALRLTNAERAHLFALCQLPAPSLPRYRVPEVSQGLRQVVEAIQGPAFLKSLRWDLVHWNRAAEALFGDLSWVPAGRKNVLYLIFADERHRSIMLDWEQDAKAAVAKFRLDAAPFFNEPSFRELVDELSALSEEFGRWWAHSDVRGRDEVVRRFRHPALGDIRVWHNAFSVDHAPGLRLDVYTPFDAITEARLSELLAAAPGEPGSDRERRSFEADPEGV